MVSEVVYIVLRFFIIKLFDFSDIVQDQDKLHLVTLNM